MKTVPVSLLEDLARFIATSNRRLVPLGAIVMGEELASALSKAGPGEGFIPSGDESFNGNPKVSPPIGSMFSIPFFITPALKPWAMLGIPKKAFTEESGPGACLLCQSAEVKTMEVEE